MLSNVETHNWSTCRELENLRCSVLNGKLLLSRLEDHYGRRNERIHKRQRYWAFLSKTVFSDHDRADVYMNSK